MSRTIRRKNFEQTRRKHVHEYYLEWDKFIVTGNGHEGYWIKRPPTKIEYGQRYWWLHGESKHNLAWSPNRVIYRHPAEKKLRAHNQRELVKYQKYPDDYEPMCQANPPSCYLDWHCH